jgi:hypothetical protein
MKSDDTSAASGGEVIDLMEVLKKSLAQNDLAPKSSRRPAAKARGKAKSKPRTSASNGQSRSPRGAGQRGTKKKAARRRVTRAA